MSEAQSQSLGVSCDEEPTSPEEKVLIKQIVEEKVKLLILKRSRKLLLEECHRQFLDGELDPRKRGKYPTSYYLKNKESEANEAI